MFYRPEAEPWMEEAKCANDRNLREWQVANREDQFFDEFSNIKGKPDLLAWRKKRAVRYCNDGCPVMADCLAYALRNDEAGIWGGTTERERSAMKRKAGKAAAKFLERLQGLSPGA